MTKGAPEKEREDSIFGEVSSLADGKDDPVKSLVGDVWEHPTHEWANNARAALAGHFVAGSGKDEGHPEEDGEPVLEERREHGTR
jgi:hypothetical protein